MSDGTTSTTRHPDDRSAAVDRPRIAAAVREILLALGEDPEREGLRETRSSPGCTPTRPRSWA